MPPVGSRSHPPAPPPIDRRKKRASDLEPPIKVPGVIDGALRQRHSKSNSTSKEGFVEEVLATRGEAIEVASSAEPVGNRCRLPAAKCASGRIDFQRTHAALSVPQACGQAALAEREVDPVNCPVASVLEFLQDRFSAGLAPSTLKVYVASISAFHAPLGDGPLGRQQLVVCFLRGAWRMRPAARTRVPTWDLAVVLEGLVEAPFEQLESAEAKNLSLKVAFLLAITSLRRVGDLQALSISNGCSRQHQSHPTSQARLFAQGGRKRLHLLCPVKALKVYIQRSPSWRKSDQLLVCFGSPKKGLPTSKQTISNWIVQAISMAYQVRNLPSPFAVRAHSTRGMASSRALLSGATIQEVCDTTGWATPHTFIRFFSLDIPLTPGTLVLSS
ncbi:hypothetical protein PO909_016093 [Leuciscus waleckii]